MKRGSGRFTVSPSDTLYPWGGGGFSVTTLQFNPILDRWGLRPVNLSKYVIPALVKLPTSEPRANSQNVFQNARNVALIRSPLVGNDRKPLEKLEKNKILLFVIRLCGYSNSPKHRLWVCRENTENWKFLKVRVIRCYHRVKKTVYKN